MHKSSQTTRALILSEQFLASFTADTLIATQLILRQFTSCQDVPAWLKSLRLHKYTSLFAELSYEEMMTLDEAELERRNVTKGARTKILQSIRKLYSRSADLRAMHERLSISHPQRCLRCAIATLRQMIATPMIPYTPLPGESSDSVDGFVCISYVSDQNVPGLIFNVLRDVQQAVFISGRQPLDLEYEYLLMLFTVFDRLCNNEAFTAAQKQRVHQWKRLARKAIRPADVRRQRIGLPHSGKCELCHYKDLSHRDNGKSNGKQNCGSSERISYHHNQQSRLNGHAFRINEVKAPQCPHFHIFMLGAIVVIGCSEGNCTTSGLLVASSYSSSIWMGANL